VAAIEVSGLVKRYGPLTAVDGVSFSVEAGEVFALLGPNGAGKSTTIEVCEGYRSRDGGTVSVLGLDPAQAGRELRDRIGIVLQSTGIERELSVREALTLYGSAYRRPRDVDEVIELVGLADKADARVKTLSGGQQRRIDLALGIIGSPEVLFLDEPTTGFDPSARRKSWDLIAALRTGGTTVVLTTHYMDEAQHLADRVAVIVGGRIVAEGTPDQLVDGPGDSRIRFRLPIGTGLPDRLLDGVTVLHGAGNGGNGAADGAGTDSRAFDLATANATALLAALCGWAVDAGIELADLEVMRPSLEDVYLSLAEPVDDVAS
jgi:ABC-2 type transport system ATP-binding protein